MDVVGRQHCQCAPRARAGSVPRPHAPQRRHGLLASDRRCLSHRSPRYVVVRRVRFDHGLFAQRCVADLASRLRFSLVSWMSCRLEGLDDPDYTALGWYSGYYCCPYEQAADYWHSCWGNRWGSVPWSWSWLAMSANMERSRDDRARRRWRYVLENSCHPGKDGRHMKNPGYPNIGRSNRQTSCRTVQAAGRNHRATVPETEHLKTRSQMHLPGLQSPPRPSVAFASLEDHKKTWLVTGMVPSNAIIIIIVSITVMADLTTTEPALCHTILDTPNFKSILSVRIHHFSERAETMYSCGKETLRRTAGAAGECHMTP